MSEVAYFIKVLRNIKNAGGSASSDYLAGKMKDLNPKQLNCILEHMHKDGFVEKQEGEKGVTYSLSKNTAIFFRFPFSR